MGKTSIAKKALYELSYFGISFLTGLKVPGVAASLLSIIGDLFKSFTGDTIKDITKDVLEKMQQNPGPINQHLHTLFSEQMETAIAEGLPLSYEKERNVKLNKGSRALLKKLGAAFKLTFNAAPLTIAELMSLLLEENNFDTFQRLYQRRLPRVDDPTLILSPDLTTYFSNNQLPIFRILFMEGLNRNEKARFEYNRMMAEETYKSIQAKKPLGTLHEVQQVVTHVTQQSLNDFEADLTQQLELAKDTNKRVISIEDGVKKGIKLSYIIIAIVIIGTAGFFSLRNNNTFHATIELRDEDNKAVTQGDVSLEYGTKKEKVALNNDGTAGFAQVPESFEDDSVEVILGEELEKKYEILPENKKIQLSANRIVHVQVRKRKPAEIPAVKPPVTTIGPKRIPTGIKQPLVEQVSTSPMPSDIKEKLNGITFSGVKSPDYLTFTSSGSNSFLFDGKVGIRAIGGKVRYKESSLIIVSGNVTGQFSLREDNTLLTGGVIVTETNTPHTIEMKSN